MFYSKSTGGFYSQEIHGESIPGDAVEISSAQYAAMLLGQSEGKRIMGNSGGFPSLVDPQALPASVPQSVTRFQALAALHLAGHLPAVEAIMAAPETDMMAKLAWANALSFERSSPLLNGLAGTLGLTSQDLDDLFTAAAGIAA